MALPTGRTGLSCRRRVHFYMMVLCTGFALCTVTLALPDIATNFFGGPDVCAAPKSERCRAARGTASVALSASQAAKAFLGLAMGPTLGTLSDVHGRFVFVVGSQVAVLVSYLALVAAQEGLGSFWLFLVLNSLTGLVPNLPALLAVVADGVPPDGRASAFGLLMASFDVSVIMGPVLGAHLSLRGITVISACASAVALALAVAYGESLPPEQRLCTQEATGERLWRPDRALAILSATPLFRRLSLVILLSTLVMAGSQQCFLLFLEAAYGLPRSSASAFLALLAISGLAIQVFLLPLLVRHAGLARTLLLGIQFQVVQNMLWAFVASEAAVAVGCVAGGFGSLVFPTISALKSNAVSESEQGRIQGAVSSLQSFALGVGPLVYGPLFGFLVGSGSPSGGPMPQGVFALSVVILLPTAVVAASLRRYVADDGSVPLVRRSVSLFQHRRQDTCANNVTQCGGKGCGGTELLAGAVTA